MLNILPINNNISNCFIPICIENNLSTYLEYKGYEYQYIFSKALNFSFDINKCNQGRIADGLDIGYNSIKWLKSLYNIEVEFIQFSSLDKLVKHIKEKLMHDEPIIIHLDSFFLPWSTLYKKQHTGHVVMVVDIDESKNGLIVLDTIEKETYFFVLNDILEKGCKFVYQLILPDDKKEIDSKENDQLIITGQIEICSNDRFFMMQEFCELFKTMFLPEKEFRDMYNVELMRTEKLIDDIRKIILGINLFCNWLLWRNKKAGYGKFESTFRIYLQIMSKWNLFSNLIYKNCLLKWEKSFRDKGYSILCEIVELEKNAYNDFLKSLRFKKNAEILQENLFERTEIHKVDLERYYNNNGFCFDLNSNQNKNLTGVGEYFLIEKINGKKIATVPLPFETEEKFDNIMCLGQEIIIECNKSCFEIIFLACAEWGSVDEIILLVGENKVQNIALHIHDISESNAKEVFVLGKTYDLTGKLIQHKAAVFQYKIQIQEMQIEKIVLPYSPNMHILAITLAVKNSNDMWSFSGI